MRSNPISFATFKSAVITNTIRILKVLEFGVKTAAECAPFGDDSNPVANMKAIYVATQSDSEPVIIGYINKNQLAATGEKRLYSVMADGSLGFYVWLRADGTLSLGGEGNNLVRYNALNTALTNKDTAINTELEKIAAAIAALSGTYVPATIITDISLSKIDQIKCI